MIYLDNAATTRIFDSAAAEMMRVMTESYGNPSSLHDAGLEAERILKNARSIVSGAFPNKGGLVFTSGGTESDNMAIVGAYESGKRRSNRIITTTIEHPAVLETLKALEKRGAEVIYVGVDRESRLDMDTLSQAAADGACLITVMAENNETGAFMPLCKVDEAKGSALFHTDGVQALGKEDVSSIPADLISVSAHKIHGPKGVGALFIKDGVKIPAFMAGGGQEKGMRSGTENTPGIAGFANAVKTTIDAFDEKRKLYADLNQALREGITSEIPDVTINSPEDGTPSILNVSFLGTRGEVILHTLEQEGIMVSTGSACSSGKNQHKFGSHVLKAMGLSLEEIEGAIRFSFGAFNTPEEIPVVVDKLKSAVLGFRRLGSFR